MTREEAFKTLKENLCGMCAYDSQCMESCDIRSCDNRDAIEALEQQSCEGAISRDDALKALDYDIKSFEFKSGVSRHMNEIANLLNTIYEIQSDNIKALPPVQLKPKTGHWITTRTFMHDGEYYCDKCKCDSPNNEKWDYCPNCGAKMIEPQESEEI